MYFLDGLPTCKRISPKCRSQNCWRSPRFCPPPTFRDPLPSRRFRSLRASLSITLLLQKQWFPDILTLLGIHKRNNNRLLGCHTYPEISSISKSTIVTLCSPYLINTNNLGALLIYSVSVLGPARRALESKTRLHLLFLNAKIAHSDLNLISFDCHVVTRGLP